MSKTSLRVTAGCFSSYQITLVSYSSRQFLQPGLQRITYILAAMSCALSAFSHWPLNSVLMGYDKNNPICVNFHSAIIVYFWMNLTSLTLHFIQRSRHFIQVLQIMSITLSPIQSLCNTLHMEVPQEFGKCFFLFEMILYILMVLVSYKEVNNTWLMILWSRIEDTCLCECCQLQIFPNTLDWGGTAHVQGEILLSKILATSVFKMKLSSRVCVKQICILCSPLESLKDRK